LDALFAVLADILKRAMNFGDSVGQSKPGFTIAVISLAMPRVTPTAA
jgi:hypothetical protein